MNHNSNTKSSQAKSTLSSAAYKAMCEDAIAHAAGTVDPSPASHPVRYSTHFKDYHSQLTTGNGDCAGVDQKVSRLQPKTTFQESPRTVRRYRKILPRGGNDPTETSTPKSRADSTSTDIQDKKHPDTCVHVQSYSSEPCEECKAFGNGNHHSINGFDTRNSVTAASSAVLDGASRTPPALSNDFSTGYNLSQLEGNVYPSQHGAPNLPSYDPQAECPAAMYGAAGDISPQHLTDYINPLLLYYPSADAPFASPQPQYYEGGDPLDGLLSIATLECPPDLGYKTGDYPTSSASASSGRTAHGWTQ